MTLKAVARKAVHTFGSLIAQRSVQSHICLCRFSKSHITAHFMQFTSATLSFKMLHMHYYIRLISVKSPTLMQTAVLFKFKSPCKSAPGSCDGFSRPDNTIWANLDNLGPNVLIRTNFAYPWCYPNKNGKFLKILSEPKAYILVNAAV